MSNFNDKIKALLAFSASFEEFKSKVETKLNQLSKPTDLSGLVKKDELAKSVGELSNELKAAKFEEFKSKVETKLNQLSKPTDLSGLVKKDEFAKSVDELSKELKAAKFDAFAFDSARRTFGEEIAVLKSFVDKGFNELRKELETLKDSKELDFLASTLSDLDKQLESVRNSIVKPKSYDAEIKALKTAIAKIPAQRDYSKDIVAVKSLIKPAKSYDAEIKELKTLIEKLPAVKSYDKELAKIESRLSGFVSAEQVKKLLAELPKPKDFSGDIASLESKLKAIKLPADKSLEVESILSRVRKLEAVKPVDYSQEIAAVKNSIPIQIDNSEQIQDLSNQLELVLSKVNDKLSELNNLEKQVKNNAIIADSARRTFGEEIGVLKSYIDKEFSKLKGENNG